jgi:oligopeptidase B
MCDPSIPLTVGEFSIVGNPNKIEDYLYMKQYCPYTNLKEIEYPSTLLIGGLHDPRVAYWEPVKFQAKLRHLKKDNNLHLLRIEMDKGHFANTDRYQSIREASFIWAFILKSLK